MFLLPLAPLFKNNNKPHDQTIVIPFGQVITLKLNNKFIITKWPLGHILNEISKLYLKHLIIKCCYCVSSNIFLKMATKLTMTKHCFHLHLRFFSTNGWKMLYNLTYGI
jgi:hypothetical protein